MTASSSAGGISFLSDAGAGAAEMGGDGVKVGLAGVASGSVCV
jgi:hypothetical protein